VHDSGFVSGVPRISEKMQQTIDYRIRDTTYGAAPGFEICMKFDRGRSDSRGGPFNVYPL
jgi:hypothetical protein